MNRASPTSVLDRFGSLPFDGMTRGSGTVAAGRGHLDGGPAPQETVLELGGNGPFIVLDDADVTEAAETGA